MSIAATDFLVPLLTPHGHLRLMPDSDAPPPLPATLAQRLSDAFARGSGHGLLHLGAAEVGSILPPSWAWWRDFAARYVTANRNNLIHEQIDGTAAANALSSLWIFGQCRTLVGLPRLTMKPFPPRPLPPPSSIGAKLL